MINRLDIADADFAARLARLLHWSPEQDQGIETAVSGILADIRARGDEALLDYTRRFDRVPATQAADLRLTKADLQAALDSLPATERTALERAAERIRRYHEHQRAASWMYTEADGTRLGQRVLPLDRVGLYVPGGKAAYPSSVLMNAIPARVAGVPELVMVVPTPDGVRNPAVLAAACLAGIEEVYTIGGAQAVAALAYGTPMIRPVDKIVGPGNAYVAEAKRRVFGTVGIDMIAGPSEILVVSDGSVPPDWVAVDLFSQAEHDEMAQSILISTDAAFLDAVAESVARLLPAQPRQAVIGKSLADRGALIRVDTLEQAAGLVNQVAPEHLELAVRDVDGLMAHIRHAGAIFMGRWGCEALGDYCAGPSHVLPTMRTARFSSPLGVYDFQKRSSLIEPSAEGADHLAKVAATLARTEGLEAHAQSAEFRLASRQVDESGAAAGRDVSGAGHDVSAAGIGVADAASVDHANTGSAASGAGVTPRGSAGTVGLITQQPAMATQAAVRVARHVRPDVQAMHGYVVPDATDAIKLDAMENPFRLPEALQAELGRTLAALAINRYPSGTTYRALKQAIAVQDGLLGADAQPDVSRLVLGNGSDELIGLLCQLVAQPGAVVMAPAPSFVMYEMSAKLAGASFVPVPLQADFSLDLPAMLQAIETYRPALVFLAYPNNPTGNLFDTAAVQAILRATDGLVVLDEAYAPFAGGASWMSQLDAWPNLAVMRTCSKWGLAGARLGYLAAQPVWTEPLDRIRPPYNISVLDAETTRFALQHFEVFAQQTVALCEARTTLAARLQALVGLQGSLGADGLDTVYPSAANFVLVRVADVVAGEATPAVAGGHAGARSGSVPAGGGQGSSDAPAGTPATAPVTQPSRASRVAAAMRERGVLIKDASRMHPLLANCLRLTVGAPAENEAMLAALTEALQAIPAGREA